MNGVNDNLYPLLPECIGYVRIVEAWGTGFEGMDHGLSEEYPSDFEVGIIEAARMSTGKGFNGWDKDEKLLNFLYTNKHMSPFEMAGMTIELAAPIFVFREWHRHRTQSYNEMSARYIPLPNDNYMPSIERVVQGAARAGANKQAQGNSGFTPTEDTVREDLPILEAVYTHMEEAYQYLLGRGWPKELARCATGVGRFSRMRASANLRNWLAFMTLRMHPAAQWEIRQYADCVGMLVQQIFPRTWRLFNEQVVHQFPTS